MLILADENFPRRVVEYLRLANHDVVWAGNDFPGSNDKDVLERAETDGRILFTLDRDFWRIAIQRRERMTKGGVVLIRVHPATADNVKKLPLIFSNPKFSAGTTRGIADPSRGGSAIHSTFSNAVSRERSIRRV
jgi:predicted nuclease of predicted toxin-antitoxin system